MDHATGLIFTLSLVYLCAGETLVVKNKFEIFARNYGITINHIHGDSGVFTSRKLFQKNLFKQ